MSPLPIRRVALYKHGLGWFCREGQVETRELTLSFPRRAMDDVLKSLVVIDREGSGVEGLRFETPPDRNPAVHRPPLAIDPAGALLGVLTAFRGRRVELQLSDGRRLPGELLGVEHAPGQALAAGRAALLAEGGMLHFPTLGELAAVTLADPTARADLDLLLRSARSDEEREQTTLRLGPGAHDLQLSYLAPAPAWRVSYRLLVEPVEGAPDPSVAQILLQGWALFENTLDEDLDDVELSLLAGQPVSFRYPLHAPRTPQRPSLDDERPVAAGMPPGAPMMLMAAEAPSPKRRSRGQMSMTAVEDSAAPMAEGREQGALFAYTVTTPVSVGRGQSAMVPLLTHRGPGRRLLHHDADQGGQHPQAMVEFDNGPLTLERGPVTVIDDSAYGGEGLLDYCPGGATLRLCYAQELGVRIEHREHRRIERQTVVIRDGGLIQQTHELRDRAFTLRSQLPRPTAVRIEYACWAPDSHFDRGPGLAAPVILAGSAQLLATVPANQSVELRSRERRLLSQRIDTDTLVPGLLRKLLDATEADPVLRARLDGILGRADQIQALLQEQGELQQQRGALFKRQQQLRENLAPLTAQGQEGELRMRLVSDLGRAQDELDGLEHRERDLASRIAVLKAEQRSALQE